jgi:hypothetical protein
MIVVMRTANERETEIAIEPVLVVAVTVTVNVVTAETETETESLIETVAETGTGSLGEIDTAKETVITIVIVIVIAMAEIQNETAKDPAEIDLRPPTQATTPHARSPDDPSVNQTTTAPEPAPLRKAPRINPRKPRKIPTHSLAKLPIANAS